MWKKKKSNEKICQDLEKKKKNKRKNIRFHLKSFDVCRFYSMMFLSSCFSIWKQKSIYLYVEQKKKSERM